MTRKKVIALACVLAVLFVVVFTAFYCRPMTIEQLSSGFDWDNVSGMAVQADERISVEQISPGPFNSDHYLRNYYGEFVPGDECFDGIASILQNKSFRRVPLPAKVVDFLGTSLWTVTLTSGDGSQTVKLAATKQFAILSAPGTICTLAVPARDSWGTEVLTLIHTHVESTELYF